MPHRMVTLSQRSVVGAARAKPSIDFWRVCGRVRVGCWSCAASRGSATRRCWSTWWEGRPGAVSRERRGLSPKWSLHMPGCISFAPRCLSSGSACPPRNVMRSQTAFGLSAAPAPAPFLVGLATLTLFAAVAEQQPLVCIVDDAQWLDQASAQILGFVARRLLAERVAIVCAARTGIGDHVLGGLPELHVRGLTDGDARALLLDNMHGPLDAAVCDQIVQESHGNPLALLELAAHLERRGTRGRVWSSRQRAGGRKDRKELRTTSRATPLGCPATRPCGRR